MKELDELGLKPKDLQTVKKWLEEWHHHFKKLSDGANANVKRYNLAKLDFFYFTDCRDVLKDNPEMKGQEDSNKIKKRKRAIEYMLLFKRLLGDDFVQIPKCTHCGNPYMWINSLGGIGHYTYCPKCAMTVVVTYPDGYLASMDLVIKDIKQHFAQIFYENKKMTGETTKLMNKIFNETV